MPSRNVGAAAGTPLDAREGDGPGPVLDAGAKKKAAAGDAGPTRRPARVRPAVHPAPAAKTASFSFSFSPAGGFIADTVAIAWRVLESARAPAGVFTTVRTVGVFSGKRSTSRSRGIAGGGVRSAARPARVNAGVTSAGDGASAFAAPGVVSTTSDVVFAGIGTGLPARVRERSATRGGSASKRFGFSFSAETRDAERVAGDAGVSAGASRGTPPSGRSRGVNRVASLAVSLAAAAEGRKAALALAVSASARAAAASASASARLRSARARATRASASSLSRSSSFFARISAAFSAAAARSATPRASNWSAREMEIRRASRSTEPGGSDTSPSTAASTPARRRCTSRNSLALFARRSSRASIARASARIFCAERSCASRRSRATSSRASRAASTPLFGVSAFRASSANPAGERRSTPTKNSGTSGSRGEASKKRGSSYRRASEATRPSSGNSGAAKTVGEA